MELLPKQIDFIRDMTTPVLGFIGGFGMGKTRGLVYKALSISIVNPPRTALMLVSPSYRMMRDTTRRTAFEVLEEERIDFDFKSGDNKVTLNDLGNEIWFRSADDPEALAGPNLSAVGLDESQKMKYRAFEISVSRARDPRAKVRQVFVVGTPDGFNWVYDTFTGKGIESGLSYKTRLITGTTLDNTYLPETYVDTMLGQYDELTARQYVYGEFVNLNQGRVYYSFSRAENVKPVTFIQGLDIYLTFDFNINPMTTSFCQIVNGNPGEQSQVINVFRTINSRNGNTDEQCKEIKRILAELNFQGKLHITGDASHPKSTTSNRTDWEIIRDHFPTADFILRKSNPAVQDRVNSVNAKLKNSKGSIGIYISPECNELVQDFEQVSWKEGTREIDKSNPKLTHNTDNIGYLVYNLFPLSGNQTTTVRNYL